MNFALSSTLEFKLFFPPWRSLLEMLKHSDICVCFQSHLNFSVKIMLMSILLLFYCYTYLNMKKSSSQNAKMGVSVKIMWSTVTGGRKQDRRRCTQLLVLSSSISLRWFSYCLGSFDMQFSWLLIILEWILFPVLCYA